MAQYEVKDGVGIIPEVVTGNKNESNKLRCTDWVGVK